MPNPISYIEFPASDIEATKAFYSRAFEWQFQDYGSEYCAFSNAGVAGGFYKADVSASVKSGSSLVVLYAEDIEQTLAIVTQQGGKIIEEIFEFPGGCRFHFADPNGNELAVWSEKVPTTLSGKAP